MLPNHSKSKNSELPIQLSEDSNYLVKIKDNCFISILISIYILFSIYVNTALFFFYFIMWCKVACFVFEDLTLIKG